MLFGAAAASSPPLTPSSTTRVRTLRPCTRGSTSRSRRRPDKPARRALPDPWPAAVGAWCPRRARAGVDASTSRQDRCAPGVPSRDGGQETGGAPTFPRDPDGSRPRSQPPVGSSTRALACPARRPAGHGNPSAFPAGPPGESSAWPRRYPCRGAIPRPAASCHPAPYAPGWGCTGRSRLTGWRGFGPVGLDPSPMRTHGATTPNGLGLLPLPRSRADLGATRAWLAGVHKISCTF
jgi:hypothetical protein